MHTLENCRRVAVLSDLHSNYYATRACLDDALAHGVEGFVFLGDYVSDLSMPRETLDLVYSIRARYPTVCLRGNRERYMFENEAGIHHFAPGTKSGSLYYTYTALTPEDFAFLKSLPYSATAVIGGVPVELAHSTMDSDRRYFDPEGGMEEVVSHMKTAYFLTGHTHRQYAYSWEGRSVFNPGSVGVPREHGDLTQYAILDVADGAIRCTLKQIEYDVEAAIRHQFEYLVPCAAVWAIMVVYDIITGEDYTLRLLECAAEKKKHSGADDTTEEFWLEVAAALKMRLSLEEILAEWRAMKKK